MSETTVERHVYIPEDKDDLPSEAGGGSKCLICGQELDAIQSQAGAMGPTRFYHVQPDELYRGVSRAGLPAWHQAIIEMAAGAIAKMRAEQEPAEEPVEPVVEKQKEFGIVTARVPIETHDALRRILQGRPHKKMSDLMAEAVGDVLRKYGEEAMVPLMPCGWGCGARLTKGELKHHFMVCPNRGLMTGGLAVADEGRLGER